MKAVQQLLHEVDWGGLDILVLDLPPGTGDTQLTITQQVILDGGFSLLTDALIREIPGSHEVVRFCYCHHTTHLGNQRRRKGNQHVQSRGREHTGLGTKHVAFHMSTLSWRNEYFWVQREG